MNKYQLILRCKSCKHKYKRQVYVADDETIDDIPNPPCPQCAKNARRADAYELATPPLPHMGMNDIIESGRAPGVIGNNNIVKAIDKTAEIVMQDHKLSDLRTNVRQGDIMAPRLPTQQQKLADNFFNPGNGANKIQRAKMQRLGQRAIQGAFRSHALDVKSVLPDARVALRKSGVEQLN